MINFYDFAFNVEAPKFLLMQNFIYQIGAISVHNHKQIENNCIWFCSKTYVFNFMKIITIVTRKTFVG